MKKLIGVSALSLVLCALNAQAKLGSKGEIKYAGDLSYSNFCEAIVKDDVRMLKRNVNRKLGIVASTKREVLKRLISEDGMACNGVDLISFSEQRKSTEVYKYLSDIK
jgi:hypothetical protein